MAWGQPQVAVGLGNAGSVADAQRTFMNRVYAWMFGGLALTGAIAWHVASAPDLFLRLRPHFLPLIGAQLVLVMVLSWAAPRLGGALAGLLFLVYAALTGVTLSVVFLVYELDSIGQAFLMTAGVFGAMSAFGTLTRRDLSGWRAFLFMGLVGVVAAGMVNLFLRDSMLDFVVACASVLIFAGLTAHDTQKLRHLHAVSGHSVAASLSVVGALTLYLDFVNLFFALLRIFGRRR